MELEESQTPFTPRPDPRPLMPEPLPVRLVAVADVRLPAPGGLGDRLDAFYADFLGFERIPHDRAYRAENFVLHFDIVEPLPDRENYRPLGIEVPSLRLAEQGLIEREYAYTRQKGLTPGSEASVLRDPAGNWLELYEARPL